MEDRYSVLITLSDQAGADGFHKNLNGRKYAPSEVLEHGKDILCSVHCMELSVFLVGLG